MQIDNCLLVFFGNLDNFSMELKSQSSIKNVAERTGLYLVELNFIFSGLDFSYPLSFKLSSAQVVIHAAAQNKREFFHDILATLTTFPLKQFGTSNLNYVGSAHEQDSISQYQP